VKINNETFKYYTTMRKIIYYFMMLSVMATSFLSCDDNEAFSKLHELTDAEREEIRLQDSIREAQLSGIDANLILKYRVDITISNTRYDGVILPISIDSIANLFEITPEQLLAGIAGESGAPEIKPFAIEGSTHADNGTASTTNSPWGHWWDANGDVTTWGATAMCFAEFSVETGSFYVGQYPGRLADGQLIKVVECLRYNGKRAAVQITIHAKAAEQLTASIVRTEELTLDVTAKSTYDPDSLEFNLSQALSDLGVSSMENVKFVGLNKDGSIAQEYTGDPAMKSYWYDMEGFVGSWGENASVYATYGNFAENRVGIGQFPGNLKAGMSLTINYGLLVGNKIVMLKIAINVHGYQDPETEPVGEPVHLEQSIQFTKAYSNDYASVKVDVRDILRDAFKKTTFQIHSAILADDLKFYQGEVTDTNPSYTASKPGYWLKADGTAAGWGESVVWCSIGHSEKELFLYAGNHPDNAQAGDVVTTKLIAVYNGGSVTFNITFTITNPE
jgi:hypothetical protein